MYDLVLCMHVVGKQKPLDKLRDKANLVEETRTTEDKQNWEIPYLKTVSLREEERRQK